MWPLIWRSPHHTKTFGRGKFISNVAKSLPPREKEREGIKYDAYINAEGKFDDQGLRCRNPEHVRDDGRRATESVWRGVRVSTGDGL